MSPGSPGGVRVPELAKLAISGGQPGLPFVAISSNQALIHGPSYPLWSRASGFRLLSRWLPAVPREDGRATGQKTALDGEELSSNYMKALVGASMLPSKE